VRPERVVEHAPSLDDDLGFSECVEQLTVEQFVSEFAVERLAVAVLSGAAGRDIERPRTEACQPATQIPGDHLGTIVHTERDNYPSKQTILRGQEAGHGDMQIS
jgi:hypothetical protein